MNMLALNDIAARIEDVRNEVAINVFNGDTIATNGGDVTRKDYMVVNPKLRELLEKTTEVEFVRFDVTSSDFEKKLSTFLRANTTLLTNAQYLHVRPTVDSFFDNENMRDVGISDFSGQQSAEFKYSYLDIFEDLGKKSICDLKMPIANILEDNKKSDNGFDFSL